MQIKLLTWNIWHGKNLNKILEFIKNANADIVALQEVVEMGITNQAAYLADNGGFKFKVYYRAVESPKRKMGNAIMSKFPIVSSQNHFLSTFTEYQGNSETEPRAAVEAALQLPDRQLTVFSTHLAYSPKNQESAEREKQVDKLLSLVKDEHTIVMGDFNADSQTVYVQKMLKRFKQTDTGLKPTWSVFPKEYNGFSVKGLEYRDDYIFVSNDINVISSAVEQSDASDHLPVSAIVDV